MEAEKVPGGRALGERARAGGPRGHALAVCPLIVPRPSPRSTAGPGSKPIAVLVTPERIASLAHLSLREAAAAAGISATAFKRACRRLGVRRWAYKRGRVPGSAGPASALQSRTASKDLPGPMKADPPFRAYPASVSDGPDPGYAATGPPDPDSSGWARAPPHACRPTLSCTAADCGGGTPGGGEELGGGAAAGAWELFGGCMPGAAPAVDDALVRGMLDAPWPLHGCR